MIILPAIDIKDGCCVRLRKGDFSTAHKVAEDAGETAASFLAAGARWIHMVDLDGAKEGEVKTRRSFWRSPGPPGSRWSWEAASATGKRSNTTWKTEFPG